MKAFVTGSTGLIGFQVLLELIRKKHRVKALVRDRSVLPDIPYSRQVEYCAGDILEKKSLQSMSGCDMVFHAAGTYTYWGLSKEEIIGNAVSGMENIIDAARKAGVSRIVFTSSSVTIGSNETGAVMSENKPGIIKDEPAYVMSKIEQERIAFAKGKSEGIEIVAICPTITVGGPDTHLTESNRMIVNYLKDPLKSTWIGGCNIVSAKDIGKAMVLLAEKGKPGEKYIAGSDNIRWKEFHSMISDLCGLPGPYLEAWHTSTYLVSVFQELIHKLTNQRPTVTREQAKMVGKYYWYSSDKLKKLGFKPSSSEDALISAISWLLTSEHITSALRAEIKPSDKIYSFRNKHSMI